MNNVTVQGLPVKSTVRCVGGANAANATCERAIAAAVGVRNYVIGFDVTFSGATAAGVVQVTLTGLAGGTLTYVLSVPAGVAVAGVPLFVRFPFPVAGSAVNTAATLTVPALGAGNTNCNATLYGFSMAG